MEGEKPVQSLWPGCLLLWVPQALSSQGRGLSSELPCWGMKCLGLHPEVEACLLGPVFGFVLGLYAASSLLWFGDSRTEMPVQCFG